MENETYRYTFLNQPEGHYKIEYVTSHKGCGFYPNIEGALDWSCGHWLTNQLSEKVWFVAVSNQEQTAPVWEGDYHVHYGDDVEILSGYTEINGSLYIQNTTLKTLDGLEALTTVRGNVDIFKTDLVKRV